MRIIAGEAKGRIIHTVPGRDVRPTLDRVKESVFNRIAGLVEGAVVLDLFAGSGNLGLEALSRGAAEAVFVEKSRQAAAVIRRNLAELGFSTRADVFQQDVRTFLKQLTTGERRFDLVLADPPYREKVGRGKLAADWGTILLSALERYAILSDSGFLILEHSKNSDFSMVGEWLIFVRKAVFGDTAVSFFRGKNR